MENTLWDKHHGHIIGHDSLNPCYHGKYPMRTKGYGMNENEELVLILVIMENTLWVDFLKMCNEEKCGYVLILVIMENTLWDPPQIHYNTNIWKS